MAAMLRPSHVTTTSLQCRASAKGSLGAIFYGLPCPARSVGQRGGRTRCLPLSSTTVLPPVELRVASVSVDIGGSVEQVKVQLTQPDSRLVEVEMQFPLGLVLENVDGQVVITQMEPCSAAAAAGCRLGDVVRATTAMTMQMTYPTMNLMFGGVGRPKLAKVLLPTSKVPFAKVMDAVRSNSEPVGGDGQIILVVERAGEVAELPGAGSQQQQQEAASVLVGVGVAAGCSVHDGASSKVFDPKIFE